MVRHLNGPGPAIACPGAGRLLEAGWVALRPGCPLLPGEVSG